MNEHLTKLMEISEPQFCTESPVLLETCTLYKDSANGTCVAYLGWKNLANPALNAIKIELIGYDVFNERTITVEYQYDDLKVEQDASFGSNTSILIANEKTTHFDVVLKAVAFANGDVYRAEASAIFLTKQKAEAKSMLEEKQQRKKEVQGKKKHSGALAIIVACLIVAMGIGYVVIKNISAAALDAKFTVGNYVTFGTYPQTETGNDATPIEWLVLARDGQKALVISRYGLDCQRYNTAYTSVTWETCTLRTWLNSTFLNKAFTANEQAAILTTNVDNSQSQCYSGYSGEGGNNTQDKIFLLSYAEAQQYFGVEYWEVSGADDNMKSRTSPTAYAIAQGAYVSGDCKTSEGNATCVWWLRSAGSSSSSAALVIYNGALFGDYVYNDIDAVRPALWLDLESGIF